MRRYGYVWCLGVLATAVSCKDRSPHLEGPSYLELPTPNPVLEKKLDCIRPLTRTGVPVRGIVTASDSSRFWVAEVASGEMPGRRFVYTSLRCSPVESSTGRRLPISSLKRGQAVVVWMEGLTIPTQPIQAIASEVRVYETASPPLHDRLTTTTH
jgi:hypothetical protein